MYICMCILENVHTLAVSVRDALLIRVSLRNIFMYIMLNIKFVKMFVINTFADIFISEHLHVVNKTSF